MNQYYSTLKILKKNGCSLVVLLLFFITVNAQRSRQISYDDFSITIQGYYGSLLTTVPKAAYIRDSYTSFTGIYISKQTNGTKAWHRANNYPQVGIGFLYGNPGSKQYLGKTVALFPFVAFPFIRKEKFKVSFRLGNGIAWIEKPFDVRTNHKNILIGSALNSYIHASVENEIKLSSSLFFNAGIAFSHISNGAINLPNFGLNMPSITAGLRYAWNAKKGYDSTGVTLFNKQPKINLFGSAGIKQTPWAGSPHYLVTVLNAEVVKPLSSINYVGAGVDFFYDPSLTKDPSGYAVSKNKSKNLQIGVHALYERKLGKLSIPLQAGVYILNASKRSIAYQVIGLRYKIDRHFSAVYSLKTHSGKADYIHAGLGYSF